MKKILILTNSSVWLYKLRKELLEELIKLNYNVYVDMPDTEFLEEVKVLGCKVHINKYLNRRGTNPIEDLNLLRFYYAFAKKLQPDVVLSYTIKPNVYGGLVCQRLGIPYIANITGLGSAVGNSGLLQKVTIMLHRAGLARAQTVFFQNSENESFFSEHSIAQGNHKMLPGSGVNLDYYKAQKYPEHETTDFVFIARLMKEKGIDQYLDAAKEIRQAYPNTRFHICGSMEESYQATIDKLQAEGTIIYHGSVADMRPIYKEINCVVHPTYYPEGMSNVLLEACSSARPIITTSIPGCREIIDDGINGFLVRANDSNDVIKKLKKFLRLSRYEQEKLGLSGRKKVEKLFDRQIVVDAYVKEVKKAVNG